MLIIILTAFFFLELSGCFLIRQALHVMTYRRNPAKNMSLQSWLDVCVAGAMLSKRWMNVSCCSALISAFFTGRVYTITYNILYPIAAGSRPRTNAGKTLIQHRRSRVNIIPAFKYLSRVYWVYALNLTL